MNDATTPTTNTPTTNTAAVLRAFVRLYMETPLEVLDRFERMYPEDARILENLVVN